MLKKLCPRCNKELINYNDKYCKECSSKVDEEIKEIHKHYKRGRVDKREQLFYNSKEWIQTRDTIKSKYKGLCLYSYYILNQIVYSDYIHHIDTIKDNWNRRLDTNNLIPISASIHQLVHDKYNNNKNDKEHMQSVLYGLLDKYKKEFG